MAEGRRTFAGANRFWADLVYAGTAFAWESANELVQIDQDKYHQVMTCEQRLANIDADGVAAEILIDGFGPNTTDPALQHEIAQGFIRWFKDYTSPAPHRFTAAFVVSLAAGQDIGRSRNRRGVRERHSLHSPPACAADCRGAAAELQPLRVRADVACARRTRHGRDLASHRSAAKNPPGVGTGRSAGGKRC